MVAPSLRLLATLLLVSAALGCAQSASCPVGTASDEGGRCSAAPDAALDDDAGVGSPEPEPPGRLIVRVPTDVTWIIAGDTAEVALRASTAPSYYGPITIMLEGLPEGVALAPDEDFAGPTFALRAVSDAPVGVRAEVMVRAFVTERPEIAGEATFTLGVRGRRGELDESFDADGIRTDVPLDGSRDTVTQIARAAEGTLIVGGNGQADGRQIGFVSWYAPDGSSAGVTQQVDILGARNTRVRGVLPMEDGLLVSVEADSEYVLRYDEDGRVDRGFVTDPTVARPSVLHGGALHRHGDGFIVSFNEQLERYHADGTLDRDFGAEGIIPVSGALVPRMAFFSDRSFVWASTSYTAGKVFMRLDAHGGRRISFGTRGVVELSGIRSLFGIVALEDGAMIFAGDTLAVSAADFRGGLTKITPRGEIDSAFGAGGERLIDDGTGAALALYGIAAHDDTIYGWGTRYVDGAPLRGFVVAYTSAGTLDTTFDHGGFVDLGEGVLPRDGFVDEVSGRLVLACDRSSSSDPGALHMIAVIRLWL